MVHNAINNAPSYLSELFHRHKTKAAYNHDTRGSTHGFCPEHSNLKFGQRNFASYGCKVWNSLDRNVQTTENQNVSRKPFEKSFLTEPRNECIFQQNFWHKLRQLLGRANALDVFRKVPSLI